MYKITNEDEYDVACIEFLHLMRSVEKNEKAMALLEAIKNYEIHEYPKHFRNANRYHRASKFRKAMYLAKIRTKAKSYIE